MPYVDQECPKCHKGIMREMTEMSKEDEQECEIELLAVIKGTEQAKAAICEVHATLLNYPLTYIDTKLTKPKRDIQEVLKTIKDIEEATGKKERVVWADYDLTRTDHKELLLDILKNHKVVAVQSLSPTTVKLWWVQ